MRARVRFLTLLLLPVVAAGACAGDDQPVIAGDESGDASAGDPVDPPAATPGGLPGDVFLVVEHVGGFLPVGSELRSVPSVTVYADGTVVVPGATVAIYPGPAVSPLATGLLDGQEVARLLEAVVAAGLLDDETPDPGSNPLVADAATTRITAVVDGRETVVEAHALELEVEEGAAGTTDEQREVRQRLTDLVGEITNVATAAADELIVPDGYRVFATEVPAAEPGIEAGVVTWPAELPTPVLGECVAITDGDAEVLTPLLAQATAITRWVVGGQEVGLAVRPMLPHEETCEA